jgi:hypothetical protein
LPASGLSLNNLLQVFTASALAGLVGNCSAIAIGAASAYELPFQRNQFDGLPAAALAGIILAPLTGAVGPASTKNCRVLVDGQQVHGRQFFAACAFPRFFRNRVAFAVILAVTDVVYLALIRSDHNSQCYNYKSNDQ